MELLKADRSPLPSWAKFVYGLGRCLAANPHGAENWHVLTFPKSRMVSGLLAAGYASSRYESPDFFARQPLDSLKEGEQITWLTADLSGLKHGVFGCSKPSTRSPMGMEFSYVCSQQGPVSRLAEFFDKFRFAQYQGTPFVNTRPLSRNVGFVESFAPGRTIDLTTQSKQEICIVGDVDVRADLLCRELSCDGIVGCLDDVLRVEHLDDSGESPHYLSLYVNPASRSLSDVTTNFTVYDGSKAVRRQRNYVNSMTSVVILDRWDPHAREVITGLKNLKARSRGVDLKLTSTLTLPEGIEYMGWTSVK